jgi:hypothetical protein
MNRLIDARKVHRWRHIQLSHLALARELWEVNGIDRHLAQKRKHARGDCQTILFARMHFLFDLFVSQNTWRRKVQILLFFKDVSRKNGLAAGEKGFYVTIAEVLI